MSAPGVIRNKTHAQTLKSFAGLAFGSISPTDIDTFMEFKDRTFVIVEAKHGDSQMPYGQRMALARLIDCCHDAGKHAILLVCSHSVDSESDAMIDIASSIVTEYRWCKEWKKAKKAITTRQAIELFMNMKQAIPETKSNVIPMR